MLKVFLSGVVTALGAVLLTAVAGWPLSEAALAGEDVTLSRLDRLLMPFATAIGVGPVLQGIALLMIGAMPFAIGARAGREIVLAPTWLRLAWVFGVVTFFVMLPWQVLAAGALALAGFACLEFGTHHGAAALAGETPGTLPAGIILAMLGAALLGGIASGKRGAEHAIRRGEAARRTMQDWITGSEGHPKDAPGLLWRGDGATAGSWTESQMAERVAARQAAIAAHEASAPVAPSAAPPRPQRDPGLREREAGKWAAAATGRTPSAQDILAGQRDQSGGVVQDMRAKKRSQGTITRA